MSLMLNVTCKPHLLNVVMLNVVMLNVVMLSVVAPSALYEKDLLSQIRQIYYSKKIYKGVNHYNFSKQDCD